MKNHKRAAGGFTLVELLVVVTLIAIVATIAISLMSGASRDAGETVNSSNIKHLTSSIGAYQQLHGGSLPDRLDSLMDSTKVAAGGSYIPLVSGSSTTSVYVVENPGTLLYIGKDTNRDGAIDSTAYTSKGVDPAAWQTLFRSLTVTQLSSNDVSNLADIGITTVYDITPSGDGNLFHGNDSYVARALKAGDPVLTVDPQTSRNGMSVYNDFGFKDLYNTTNYPTSGSLGLSSDSRAKAMSAMRYLVFGIGANATMIGDRKAGLQEAPSSKVVKPGFYSRYLLVVKMAPGPTDMDNDFAGVLDPRGNTSRGADSWATRTGK